MIFEKKIIEHKIYVLIFSTNLSETFLSKKNLARYYHTCILLFM
jgi:hypothetical protein